MNYKAIYFNLIEKVDQFSVRERILILITSLAAVFFLWQVIIFDQIDYLKNKISSNITKMQQQISNFQGQINQVTTTLSLDPIVRLEEQVKKLYKENEELKAKLFTMKEKLISPEQMILVLKNILDNKTLDIISLKNLPFIPVITDQNAKEQSEEEKDVVDSSSNLTFKVYKHGLEIIFNGSFFQVRDFLLEAESLPYKLLWEELEFAVTEYPLAKVKIVIGALSVNIGLIGNSF